MKRTALFTVIASLVMPLVLIGCATSGHRFKEFTPKPDGITQLPMTLALVLPPSVCSHAHLVGDIRPSVYHVGETVCRNIEEAGRRHYRTVKIVRKAGDVDNTDADAVLTIRTISLHNYYQQTIPAVVGYTAAIGWSFATTDGKSRYVWTVEGHGVDARTFGYVHPRHRDSLQRCLDDLGHKVSLELAAALEKGRKNLAAESDMLTKFEGYAVGHTTLDVFKQDEVAGWNVRLDTREIKSGRFQDNRVTMEAYEKHIVRSAFGESLVCELEFFGKGETSVPLLLSSIRCETDGEIVLSRGIVADK